MQPARVEPAPVVEGDPPEPEISTPEVSEPEVDEPDIGERDYQSTAGSPGDPRWRPLIDPVSVIGGIGRSKKLIAATTLIGALIGIAIALSTPKKYEAFAELLIDPRDLKLSDRDLSRKLAVPTPQRWRIIKHRCACWGCPQPGRRQS